MTVLSVNLNKVALVRNSRGGDLPSVEWAARTCIDAGAAGITLHPRPDGRHALGSDAYMLAKWLPVELNLEGNPFAEASATYDGFLEIVARARPAQATLVPDSDDQLTSDHGWNLALDGERLAPIIERLKAYGCRVSLFMDVDSAGAEENMRLAAEIGADRVELYTGPYAEAFASGDYSGELAHLAHAAEAARALGLGINAGHDLDLENLGPLIKTIPYIQEVSIGHALVGEALKVGLARAVESYLGALTLSEGLSRSVNM